MSAKAVLVFCVQALLAHVTFSQCVYPGAEYLRALAAPSIGAPSCGALGGSGLAYGAGLGIGAGLGNGWTGAGLIEVTPTSGGALPVTSASATAPTGLFVSSENVYEGSLLLAGELPFLGTVALEGALPSAGAGVVSYGCGNGITAITSNTPNSVGAIGLGAAGIGPGAFGYGAGLGALTPGASLGLAGRCGCGCRY